MISLFLTRAISNSRFRFSRFSMVFWRLNMICLQKFSTFRFEVRTRDPRTARSRYRPVRMVSRIFKILLVLVLDFGPWIPGPEWYWNLQRTCIKDLWQLTFHNHNIWINRLVWVLYQFLLWLPIFSILANEEIQHYKFCLVQLYVLLSWNSTGQI